MSVAFFTTIWKAKIQFSNLRATFSVVMFSEKKKTCFVHKFVMGISLSFSMKVFIDTTLHFAGKSRRSRLKLILIGMFCAVHIFA